MCRALRIIFTGGGIRSVSFIKLDIDDMYVSFIEIACTGSFIMCIECGLWVIGDSSSDGGVCT